MFLFLHLKLFIDSIILFNVESSLMLLLDIAFFIKFKARSLSIFGGNNPFVEKEMSLLNYFSSTFIFKK